MNKNIAYGLWNHAFVILLTGPIAIYYSLITGLSKNQLWVGISMIAFGIIMTRLKMWYREPQLPRGVILNVVYWFMPAFILLMMVDGMSNTPSVDIHRIISFGAIYILCKHMEFIYEEDILHIKPQ